jgi:hypothetical protein
MSAECRGCHQHITWAHTVQGHRIPLDPDQVPDGNVVAQADGRVRVLRSGETPDPAMPRYRSHFASCPNAARHRKPRNPAPTLF